MTSPRSALVRQTKGHPLSYDYAELVDWTGRLVHPHKKGCMAQGSPALLARLGVEADALAHAAQPLPRNTKLEQKPLVQALGAVKAKQTQIFLNTLPVLKQTRTAL